MDIHTAMDRRDYENSTIIRTSFYTEKIKNPTQQKAIKFKIGQWIKKMLPLR